MRLSHFTDERPWALRAFETPPDHYDPLHKPYGLWLSVDGEDDWPDWCRAEGFGLERLKQRHVIEITNPARIKMISTVEALDDFHSRYAVARSPAMETRYGREYVDWREVAGHYGGIIITPYLWERRLSGPGSRWYYGWDCASGCVWDVSTVRHVRSEPFVLPDDRPSTANASLPRAGGDVAQRVDDELADDVPDGQ